MARLQSIFPNSSSGHFGAFSHHKAGGSSMDDDYIEAFATWAQGILDRCPQAIVVIPDVIGGTEAENAQLILEWPLERARSMAVWHLDESIDSLLHRCVDHEWIAFGSSGQYWQIGTEAWHARVREALAAIDAWAAESDGAYVRPRIHMMRAQSQAHLYAFDSSDSCNVAINHSRQLRLGETFPAFAGRVDAKIQASAGPASEHQRKRPMLSGWEFEQAMAQLLEPELELREAA